jgi:hypothetical protein
MVKLENFNIKKKTQKNDIQRLLPSPECFARHTGFTCLLQLRFGNFRVYTVTFLGVFG